ncbi:hypothetical protein IH992_10590 [Candidatus Poribacteria bacterium]|nr:hypothetical protein [Candidatus Poribacteria bacterium]
MDFTDRKQVRQFISENDIRDVGSLNKMLKNISGVFPDDNALLKLLYLATQDVTRKWTMKIRNWNQILAQLAIHFEDRVTQYL